MKFTGESRMLKNALLFSLFVSSVGSAVANERIVYGLDNRLETVDADQKYQGWAKSTAGMIDSLKLIDIGSHYLLPPSSLGKDFGLCEGERFKDQPSPLSCSGFLVGPDLLVTAGHCIGTQKDCDSVSWVFDFKVKKSSNKANIAVEKSNVYKCKKVIDQKLEGQGDEMRDYSLIQLDRVPVSRKPLKYRTKGKVLTKEELVLIGHPSGLPQKIASKGFVYVNNSNHYFKTNLDSFGGNSGSAVFNAKTGAVEGILVRGATDYVSDSCGNRVNKVPEDITGKQSLGESVSRITDIDGLKKQRHFLDLLKKGSFKQAKEIAEKGSEGISFFIRGITEEGDTAVHLAVKAKNQKMLEWVLKNGAYVNLVNDKGETALHVAAFVNNQAAVGELLDSGADILMRDNFDALPSGRTNYFAFKFRSYLEKLQNVEKEKKALRKVE